MKQLIKQIYFILLRQWVRYKLTRLSERLSYEGIEEGGRHFPIRY